MSKVSVRMVQGRRANRRKTPSGSSYVFYCPPSGGKWLHFDDEVKTDSRDFDEDHNARAKKDIEYFRSSDMFEVVDGWVSNRPRVDSTDEPSVVARATSKLEETVKLAEAAKPAEKPRVRKKVRSGKK